MYIAVIGGLDRAARQLANLAEAEGHRVECHRGDMAGRGSDALGALVERSDVVVVLTDVNSHAAVWSARRLAKSRGLPCLLMRKMGFSRFRALLHELNEERAEPPCWRERCA